MKINKKALELIEKGLTSKTVSKLTESQIDVLHSKLVVEQVSEIPSKKTYKVGPEGGSLPPSPKGYSLRQDPDTKVVVATAAEGEVKETDDITDKNALGADSLQNITGQDAPHDANDMAPDGMDDDSDDNRNMMGMTEETESNPWAICTSQLGKEFKTTERSQWSPKQKAKYERCVKDVKKSLKEGKNPVSLFLENEIMKIVERNLPPRITKGDLVKYIAENGPAVAPTKPKPTVKPGKPETRPRPSHPGKNPNPGVNPAPKAVSPDKAKDKVIDLIINLLEK